MGLFVKVGTTQEFEARETSKLVEAAREGSSFSMWEGSIGPSRRTAVGRHAGGG